MIKRALCTSPQKLFSMKMLSCDICQSKLHDVKIHYLGVTDISFKFMLQWTWIIRQQETTTQIFSFSECLLFRKHSFSAWHYFVFTELNLWSYNFYLSQGSHTLGAGPHVAHQFILYTPLTNFTPVIECGLSVTEFFHLKCLSSLKAKKVCHPWMVIHNMSAEIGNNSVKSLIQ